MKPASPIKLGKNRSRGDQPRPAYPTGAANFAPPPPASTITPAAAPPAAKSELELRREKLADAYAEGQWNLGGLVYEMAIRDHFRLDVIKFRAAKLQEIDAELGEVERLLRIDTASAGGECDTCGALFGRGSHFCWQCGSPLGGEVAP